MQPPAPTSQQAARPRSGRPELPPPSPASTTARPDDDAGHRRGCGAYWWKPVAGRTEHRKRRRGICLRWGCTKSAGAKKCFCPQHHHQAQKARDLISYIYSMRKQRAKQRGHEWTITLENFRQWCEWTGYHHQTGRTADAASIDRKDSHHGYHVWNIKVLPYGANSAKSRHGEGTWALGVDGHYHYIPANTDDPNECPF